MAAIANVKHGVTTIQAMGHDLWQSSRPDNRKEEMKCSVRIRNLAVSFTLLSSLFLIPYYIISLSSWPASAWVSRQDECDAVWSLQIYTGHPPKHHRMFSRKTAAAHEPKCSHAWCRNTCFHTFHSTLHTSHSQLHATHSPLHTSHSTLHTRHFTLHNSHHPFYSPNFAPHILHSTLPTSHSTLPSSHSTLPTSHSTPQTPQTRYSSPHILLSTLHTPHATLHTPLHTPHFRLHTPHFTCPTPHDTSKVLRLPRKKNVCYLKIDVSCNASIIFRNVSELSHKICTFFSLLTIWRRVKNAICKKTQLDTSKALRRPRKMNMHISKVLLRLPRIPKM